MANEIRFGLSNEAGDVVGGEMEAVGALDGLQAVYELDFPPTTQAAQGWWFAVPDDAVLVSVVSLGVETTLQWALTGDGARYVLFFGLPDVKNFAVIRLMLSEMAAGVSTIVDRRGVLDVARVAYSPVVFTDDEQTALLTYLRGAIRVSDTNANNERLLQLFRSALREVETYCVHALYQRSFTSRILFQDPGVDALASVHGRWRALHSVTGVTAAGLPVPVLPSGHFRARSGIVYEAEFILGPYDGPSAGFGDDVLEGLARLVGYRWDGGIFQRSALWQSGCLDAMSRYVNREAVII